MSIITELLQRVREEKPGAREDLFEALYPELKRIARARLAGHVRVDAMQTTVLVHECFLKLIASPNLSPADRAQFLSYAAHTMRSVIVDAVRSSRRERRGGDVPHVPLDTETSAQIAVVEDEILDIDAALAELARVDMRLVQVVEMRFFAGMTDAQIGQVLGVTDRTVRRDWEKARLLLAAALRG